MTSFNSNSIPDTMSSRRTGAWYSAFALLTCKGLLCRDVLFSWIFFSLVSSLCITHPTVGPAWRSG
ncbi:hypothetical protein BJX62DRAFT_212579 [Aspergillus germanicus]